MEEEEGAKWLAEALEPEVVPFLSEEIGIKNSVWRQKSMDKEVSFQPTPGERAEQNLGQKITGAFQPGSTEHHSPIKERNLRSKPIKS